MTTVTNAELKTLLQTNATTTNQNFKKAKKAIDGKVDKVNGKGLSTEDFTSAEKTKLGALPTNSELQTALDAKTTLSAVQALGYQTATDVQTAISGANHLVKSIVAELPAVANADANTIYMIAKTSGKNGNAYDEYMLINGAFEKIGDTEVDLTNYALKSELPTKVSDLTNDAGYLTAHQDITGKQDVIDSSNKLDADLVDDSTATHKFVSASDKSNWNGKQDAISDLATIRSNATAGKSASDAIAQYGDIVSHNASEFLTAHQDITGKQDVIDSFHKLSADLVDDSNATNKFVSASDKSNWNGKQDAIDSSHKLSADLVDDSNATHKFVTSAQLTAIGTIANKVEAQDVTDTINEIFGSLSITAWDSIDISD